MVTPLAPYKITQKDINLWAISQQKQPVQQPKVQAPVKSSKLSFTDFAQRIKTKYPEYKDLADLDLTERMIQAYPQYKEQVELPERFRGAEILAGISRAWAWFIPKTVWGIAKFIWKQWVAPWLDIQTPQTEALTKFGEQATDVGQQAEDFVRKWYSELWVQQNTNFRKGSQLWTDIALSVAWWPTWPSFPWFKAWVKPLAKYVAWRGLIGASEEMRYNLGTEWQVLSDKRPYDMAIWTTAEIVVPMLPSIAKWLYKWAKELPSMIKWAKETVSEIPWAIWQKVTRDFPIWRIEKDLNLTPTERASVERTWETAWNYVLRKNIWWLDKPNQINELQKIADEWYNWLTDALKPIKETTASENAEKMLDTMIEEMTDSKVLMKEYQPYINRLQELRGQWTYSASEKLAIKRDFDRIIWNKLFNSKWMVSGIEEKTIAKWRNNLMQEIEDEATKYWVDVKAYNVDVRNSTTIRDWLLRRLSQENKNNEFGLQDIGIWAILWQGDPFISAWVIVAKKWIEKTMPSIAQKLYNLSNAKNVPTNLKRGVAITPRDVTDGFSIAPAVNDSLTTPWVTKALPAPKATVIAPWGLPQVPKQPKVKWPSTPLILETWMKNVKKTPETPRKTILTKTEAPKIDISEKLKKLEADPTLEKVPQTYLQRWKDRVIETKYGTVTEMIKNNHWNVIKVKVWNLIYDANDLDFFEKKIDLWDNAPIKAWIDNQKSLEKMSSDWQRNSVKINEWLKELWVKSIDDLNAQQMKNFAELIRARNYTDTRWTKRDALKKEVQTFKASKKATNAQVPTKLKKLVAEKKTPLKQASDNANISPKIPNVLKTPTPVSKVDDALPVWEKMWNTKKMELSGLWGVKTVKPNNQLKFNQWADYEAVRLVVNDKDAMVARYWALRNKDMQALTGKWNKLTEWEKLEMKRILKDLWVDDKTATARHQFLKDEAKRVRSSSDQVLHEIKDDFREKQTPTSTPALWKPTSKVDDWLIAEASKTELQKKIVDDVEKQVKKFWEFKDVDVTNKNEVFSQFEDPKAKEKTLSWISYATADKMGMLDTQLRQQWHKGVRNSDFWAMYKLKDVYENKEFYDKYPSLKDVNVIFADFHTPRKYWVTVGNDIYINSKLYSQDKNKLRSTIVHEIQHLKQDIRWMKARDTEVDNRILWERYKTDPREIDAKRKQEQYLQSLQR